MNRRSADVGNRKVLYLSGLWVKPADLVRNSKIRDPQIAILVGRRAKRNTAGSWHRIFHINDFHGLVVEFPPRFRVLRHFRWRFRQYGIGAEKVGQIRRHVGSVLSRESPR